MTEKGIKGLTVTFESFDGVVVGEMKGLVQGILDNPWEGHHDYKESLKDVDGFFRVLSWYMRPSEYNEYFEGLKPMYDDLVEKAFPKNPVGDLDIIILEVRDLPDGGANIEYEASPKMKEFLIGIGFQKILEDACKALEVDAVKEGIHMGYTDVPGWEYWEASFIGDLGEMKNYKVRF